MRLGIIVADLHDDGDTLLLHIEFAEHPVDATMVSHCKCFFHRKPLKLLQSLSKKLVI